MSKLADRYAVALYQVTQENQRCHQVYLDLLDVLSVLKEEPIANYFRARDVDKQEKMNVIEKSISSENQEILGLLKLLIKNHRMNIFAEIVKSFEGLHYQHENIKIAEVTSAVALSETQQQALRDSLSKKYQSQIDVRLKVDQSLIQGLVIKIGDDILDNSIKTKFKQLHQALLSGGR